MPIKIADLSDNNEEPEVKEGSGLNELLSSYNKPAENVAPDIPANPPPVEEEKQPVEQTVKPDVPGDSWRGNPDYYQSGKKMGQLKPKKKVSVSYNTAATQSIPGTVLVNAAMFISIVDLIIPAFAAFVSNWITGKKIDYKDIKLDSDAKKEVTPLMDATLKQFNIQGNPAVLLGLALVSVYSMKITKANLEYNVKQKENGNITKV